MVLIPRNKLAVASFFGGNYYKKVLGTEPADLIAYWPLWEKSGTVGENLVVASGMDAGFIGPTLGGPGIGDGRTCPLFDGVNDRVTYNNAAFQAAVDLDEGTLAVWAKVLDGTIWPGEPAHYIMCCHAGGEDYIYIFKQTTAGRLAVSREAGDVKLNWNHDGISTTEWFHLALTWSVTADEQKCYFNGSQLGATLTGLGAWNDFTWNPAYSSYGTSVQRAAGWAGWLAHPSWWTKPLSGDQVLNLARV